MIELNRHTCSSLSLARFMQEFELNYAVIKNASRSIDPAERLADLDLDSLAVLEVLVTLEELYEVKLVGRPCLIDAVSVHDLFEVVSRELSMMADQSCQSVGLAIRNVHARTVSDHV
jgi:acyl carrier protein